MRGEFTEQGRVVDGVDDDRDIVVIFCGGPDHRRAADIDILDALGKIGAACDGGFEWIEIDHQYIDAANGMRPHRLDVFRIVANAEQAAMHRRMQRLDPAIHHFWKSGEVANVHDRKAGIAQRQARPAGRHQFDTETRKRAGELDHSGFIGDGNESTGGAAQPIGHCLSNIFTAVISARRRGCGGPRSRRQAL